MKNKSDIYIIQTMITEKSINFHVKLNFNNKRWNIGNMEWGYVFDLVNITGWTPLVLAGPPPCPGQGSGVPHYPGGVSDAGGNPSLTCLWNSLRPSCHPPTTERQWTLNKPVLLYKWPFYVFRTCAQSICYHHLSNKIGSNSTLQKSPQI